MPLPHESATEPVTELPKPELNPMLNPTLGRNLGRWAHAYFTSPPEKREQAVVELLRELEAESGTGSAAGPINLNGVPTNEASTRVATEARVIPETVLCAECGHQNAKSQRYCGMCGSPLTADDPMPRSSEHEPLPARAPDLTLRESPPVQEPVFPTLSLFAQANDERSSRGSEIRWLRDRDMDDEDTTSPALKYVLIVLVILVAGAFFYNRSRMQAARGPGEQGSSGVWTGTRSPSQPAPVPAPASTPSTSTPEAAAKPADNAPQVPVPTSTPVPVKGSPPHPQKVENASDLGRISAAADAEPGQVPPKPTTSAELPPAAAEASSVTSGSAELAMAEEYLTGKRGPRNSAVAATFLWRAVSKENTTATLLLSDLYRTGDGVPKSCDQARVLLYAAARKNVPEAGRKLRDLQAGCP